jgi:hypothetical protein
MSIDDKNYQANLQADIGAISPVMMQQIFSVKHMEPLGLPPSFRPSGEELVPQLEETKYKELRRMSPNVLYNRWLAAATAKGQHITVDTAFRDALRIPYMQELQEAYGTLVIAYDESIRTKFYIMGGSIVLWGNPGAVPGLEHHSGMFDQWETAFASVQGLPIAKVSFSLSSPLTDFEVLTSDLQRRCVLSSIEKSGVWSDERGRKDYDYLLSEARLKENMESQIRFLSRALKTIAEGTTGNRFPGMTHEQYAKLTIKHVHGPEGMEKDF